MLRKHVIGNSSMNRDEITLMKMGEIKIDRVDYNISFYSSMEIK